MTSPRAAAISSSRPAAISSARGRSAARRGVNTFCTRRRSRVWSGGSAWSMCAQTPVASLGRDRPPPGQRWTSFASRGSVRTVRTSA